MDNETLFTILFPVIIISVLIIYFGCRRIINQKEENKNE
jgi:hypothetical protein